MEDERKTPSAGGEAVPGKEKKAAAPKKAARKAPPISQSEDEALCNELLCSSSSEDHRKAFELACKNIEMQWGKSATFRMEYCGIGTERNVQKAKKTLFTGTALARWHTRVPFLFTVNPSVFDYSKVVFCGSPEELRVLFCVCAEYSVRPDYYKTDPGAKVLEIMGTECPNNRESKCYIMFASAKGKYTRSTKCLYYHPSSEDFIPDESSLLVLDYRISRYEPVICAEGKLRENLEKILAAKGCSGKKCDVVALNPASYRRSAPITDSDGPAILDQRPYNEAGYYVSLLQRKVDTIVSAESIDRQYRMGRALYEKVKALGERAAMCSYPHMGDHFRWLCRYDGLDYSDMTFVVTEVAAILPKLLGVKGTVISRNDSGYLRQYISMLGEPDDSFLVVPFRPLHPGVAYVFDYQTNCLSGISKRANEPCLMGFSTEDGEAPKRSRYICRHKILLNPYGNSINHRSAEEKDRDARIMKALARFLNGEGFDVYTNAPFPDQKPLRFTKRYAASVEQMVYEACEFDLVVSVFTGFMETLIPTGCNMVVLSYASNDTRTTMAERFNPENYWEFNVMTEEPINIVRKILRVARKVSGKPSQDTPMPSELMTLKDRAKAFSGMDIDEKLVDFILGTVCKGEVEAAIAEGSDDHLVCCVIARFLENRGEGTDVSDAVSWYGKAAGAGVEWASGRASALAADPGKSKAAIRKARAKKVV